MTGLANIFSLWFLKMTLDPIILQLIFIIIHLARFLPNLICGSAGILWAQALEFMAFTKLRKNLNWQFVHQQICNPFARCKADKIMVPVVQVIKCMLGLVVDQNGLRVLKNVPIAIINLPSLVVFNLSWHHKATHNFGYISIILLAVHPD